MYPKIRVLLADDHPMVREGLKASIESDNRITVVGEAINGQQAVDMAEALSPDIVLLDISMPVLTGLQAAEILRKTQPKVKVLVLTMHEDREYIAKMVQLGVAGYVLKDVATEKLIFAIQEVHQKGEYFGTVAAKLIDEMEDASEADRILSQREETVLTLLAEGLGNKEIAEKLDLSIRTVESHRHRIKQKLNISTSAGLVHYAIHQNLIKI